MKQKFNENCMNEKADKQGIKIWRNFLLPDHGNDAYAWPLKNRPKIILKICLLLNKCPYIFYILIIKILNIFIRLC